MPLERHWERVNTPLRSTTRRERRVVVAVAVLLAIAVAVTLFATLDGGSSEAGPGCIRLTVPSTMGGATVHACGPAAARWCHSAESRQAAIARKARAQCQRAGYP
jgi:predicted metal-binding membrane protein